MKVTFYSTFLTMHQVPFCNQMHELLKDDFHYVSCERIYPERLKLGYPDLDSAYPYVIRKYESQEAYEKAKELSMESDAVIIGSAPEEFCRKRLLLRNGLTFKYREREFKKGNEDHSLRFLAEIAYRHQSYRRRNCYLLAAGAYAAQDFRRYGCYVGKALKWGYFTETEPSYQQRNHEIPTVLWAGRMIDWKHPEYAVMLAKSLAEKNINAKIQMAGTGPMLSRLQEAGKGLANLSFIGPVPQEKMRICLQQSDLFLMTSDRQEGWGAIVNEAMTNGCAVIGCRQAGCIPWLIEDGVNGSVFEQGNYASFERKATDLLKNYTLMQEYGRKSYQKINTEWNGRAAADRLLRFTESCLADDPRYEKEGPCSRAE